MNIEAIHSNKIPKSIGPYSQALKVNGFIFISGQIGIDPKTGILIGPDIQSQTKQILDNIEAILSSVGLGFKNIVKTEIFLKSMIHFDIVNDIYKEKFTQEIKPTRQTIEVSGLPLDALIEISCIAVE